MCVGIALFSNLPFGPFSNGQGIIALGIADRLSETLKKLCPVALYWCTIVAFSDTGRDKLRTAFIIYGNFFPI